MSCLDIHNASNNCKNIEDISAIQTGVEGDVSMDALGNVSNSNTTSSKTEINNSVLNGSIRLIKWLNFYLF